MTTAERGIGEDDVEECTASSFYFLSVQVGAQVQCWYLSVADYCKLVLGFPQQSNKISIIFQLASCTNNYS